MSVGAIGYVVLLTALLAAGSAVAERANQGRSATRHVWTAAILLSLVAPAAALVWRMYTQLHLLTFGAGVSSATLTPIARSGLATGMSSTWPALEQQVIDALGSKISSVALGAWILSSLALLSWVCAAAAYWRRASRTWQRSTLDGIDVAVAPRTGPAVLGLLTHRIVIPAWAAAMSPDHRRLVLAHESEHIRSRDPERLALARAALVLMPWNIALWWCAARMRRAIEVDCDARVLQMYPDARTYGYVLLEVAARGRDIGALTVPIVALMRRPSELEWRLRAISRPSNSGGLASIVGGISVTVLGLAAFATPVPLLRAIAPSAQPTESAAQGLPKHATLRADTLPVDDRTYSEKEVDTPATIRSDSPTPSYPVSARKQHLSGEVRVVFVVGADGRIQPGSPRIVKSNNPLFSNAVTSALPRMRFNAAEYRGHRVKQIVEQPFTFESPPLK